MRSVESRIWKISTYGLTRGMVHRHPPQRLRFDFYKPVPLKPKREHKDE